MSPICAFSYTYICLDRNQGTQVVHQSSGQNPTSLSLEGAGYCQRWFLSRGVGESAKTPRPRWLGVLNLEYMSWALQIRWLWLKKTDLSRPWRGLEIPVHSNAVALFSIALDSHVGRGDNTLFWSDRWLMGCCLGDLAPAVVAAVPLKVRNQRTVSEAFLHNSWPNDIQGGLSLIGLFEYFQLWDLLQDTLLYHEDDCHTWRFEVSGKFTSKSAYRAFFQGSVVFEPWRRLWKTWAPGKCKIFIWLAIRNRCWTADRLSRRGLPHPEQCVLCDQADENIQHILTSCVFAREFWFKILEPLGFSTCVPGRHEHHFAEWWRKVCKRVPKDKRKGFNTVIIMGSWLLWKHRNACVFEGARPNVNALVHLFRDEQHLWCIAGARGLRALGHGGVVG